MVPTLSVTGSPALVEPPEPPPPHAATAAAHAATSARARGARRESGYCEITAASSCGVRDATTRSQSVPELIARKSRVDAARDRLEPGRAGGGAGGHRRADGLLRRVGVRRPRRGRL